MRIGGVSGFGGLRSALRACILSAWWAKRLAIAAVFKFWVLANLETVTENYGNRI